MHHFKNIEENKTTIYSSRTSCPGLEQAQHMWRGLKGPCFFSYEQLLWILPLDAEKHIYSIAL
jgi:hypothetical protein